METATWTFNYDGSGALDQQALVPSSDSLAPGDVVEFISASLTGDFSSCTATHFPPSLIQIKVPLSHYYPDPGNTDGRWDMAAWQPGSGNVTDFQGASVQSSPLQIIEAGPFSIKARCIHEEPNTAQTLLPVPAFTFTFVFKWTHALPPAQATFN